MTSLQGANARSMENAQRGYELDTQITFDMINGIFDVVSYNGLTLADFFPEERANAIASSLEFVRQGYQTLGVPTEASQEELDAHAEVERFELER